MGQKSGVRERLDVLMVFRGLAESREQAKRLILAGAVEIDGVLLPKPGQMLDTSVNIQLKAKERYVSRGGLKLQAALESFGINISDCDCADIGASTGGFTDCMIQHKARRVFSVDVGATQMHEKVRLDSRVVLLEHTNAKNLAPEMFPVKPVFAAVDVSFISILRVTGPLHDVLSSDGSAVFLIKPQFEAGRQAVARGRGIIRDEAVHREVLQTVMAGLAEQGWSVLGLIPSPIAGGSGNREFLCYARKARNSDNIEPVKHIDIDEVIRSAGATLK